MSKKKQYIQVISVIFITLFIATCIPIALAGNGVQVNKRPINDWIGNNPFGIGLSWWCAYVGDDGEGNNYWIWPDSLFGDFTGLSYEYEGMVKEKVLQDGSIDITVKLQAKGIYLEIYDALYDELGNPIWSLQYFGDTGDIRGYAFVDYYFQLKFTLDAEYEGYEPYGIPAGTREAGCMLPFWDAIMYFPDEMGIHLQSLMLLMYGEGPTYEPGWRWPPDGNPANSPIEDGGTGRIFAYEFAKFNSNTIEWPFGANGFKSNYISWTKQ